MDEIGAQIKQIGGLIKITIIINTEAAKIRYRVKCAELPTEERGKSTKYFVYLEKSGIAKSYWIGFIPQMLIIIMTLTR